MVAFQIVLEG
uniref:Uncharacterized protein n=1 Tax=Rhizophora mucronata TaxID=61149 RepID=A0A2P2R249_RHIMU